MELQEIAEDASDIEELKRLRKSAVDSFVSLQKEFSFCITKGDLDGAKQTVLKLIYFDRLLSQLCDRTGETVPIL